MNSRAPTVCLDSNVFISFLRGDEPTSRACADVLTDAAKGGVHAVTSSLAIVETVYLSNASAPESEVEATIRNLYSQPWLKIWNLDKPIALEASRLSRRYLGTKRRSTPHDPHVATAKAARASFVFTLDEDFIKRFAGNGEGVEVCLPRAMGPQILLPV